MPLEPLRITNYSSLLLDEPLAIQLDGFTPGARVTVRASMRDDLDRRWASASTFLADETGHVDLATQVPIAGDYTGVDPLGLCWSMALPPDAVEVSPFVLSSAKPRQLHLAAERALDVSFAYGGTPQGSAYAARESWRAVLAFLAAWQGHPA